MQEAVHSLKLGVAQIGGLTVTLSRPKVCSLSYLLYTIHLAATYMQSYTATRLETITS
jgi:hypothetical protein